jgi:hypothetical protein
MKTIWKNRLSTLNSVEKEHEDEEDPNSCFGLGPAIDVSGDG